VASQSPRLLYSATLRHAVLAANPNGVASQSPRLLYSATLGHAVLAANPNGVASCTGKIHDVVQDRSQFDIFFVRLLCWFAPLSHWANKCL